MTTPVKDPANKKGRAATYFKGVRSEMKKIIWPNKKDLTNYTLAVLFISALVALIVFGLDISFRQIISAVVK